MHVARPRAAKELQLVVAVVSLCCLGPVRTNAEIREGKEAARSASVRACVHAARARKISLGGDMPANLRIGDMPERITHTRAYNTGILSSRTRRVLRIDDAGPR